MDKFKEIRPVVLGLAKHNDKLLVSKGYDSKDDYYFYRCLGGGIEFQETSDVALKREFMEELGLDIKVKDFLGISENIFTYNGKKGHELILFYNIEIPYQESYIQTEGDDVDEAVWVSIEDFKSGKEVLYPKEVFKYL